MSESDHFAELAEAIASKEAILFTGAGFSAEARDRAGQPLPESRAMVEDLWRMLFGGQPQDDSTLADLYDVALVRAPDRLRDYLATRLRIGDRALPRTFAQWFGAPWRRAYTLNVDDLESAVARQFELPRSLVSISALSEERPDRSDGLEVIHLNGVAGDDPAQVTFSTMQYAARLCAPDREYQRLVEDLRTAPFVFVGTTLDEVVLWKHVQVERQLNGDATTRRHSFLISRHLTRARQLLLSSHRIQWVQATASEIAERVLARL